MLCFDDVFGLSLYLFDNEIKCMFSKVVYHSLLKWTVSISRFLQPLRAVCIRHTPPSLDQVRGKSRNIDVLCDLYGHAINVSQLSLSFHPASPSGIMTPFIKSREISQVQPATKIPSSGESERWLATCIVRSRVIVTVPTFNSCTKCTGCALYTTARPIANPVSWVWMQERPHNWT